MASIVARNYAETLLALAQKNGGAPTVQAFLESANELAALMRDDAGVRRFMETPRVGPAAKRKVLRAALQGRAHEMFVRFVELVVAKRRQTLLPQIAEAYSDLVDRLLGRVRVEVAMAVPADDSLRQDVQRALEQRLGTAVVPTFTVDPALVGGVVVRVGDQVLDGSVRRQAQELRRRMISAELPHGAAAV